MGKHLFKFVIIPFYLKWNRSWPSCWDKKMLNVYKILLLLSKNTVPVWTWAEFFGTNYFASIALVWPEYVSGGILNEVLQWPLVRAMWCVLIRQNHVAVKSMIFPRLLQTIDAATPQYHFVEAISSSLMRDATWRHCNRVVFRKLLQQPVL